MSQFAKILESEEHGQILVYIEVCDVEYKMHVKFMIEDIFAEVAYTFSGNKKLLEAFQKATLGTLEPVVSQTKRQINK